ncbi:MAG: MFS transporter [Propionibacteriales bacterium]|nr:MFS transporter [Propionibacteriales bacterium]
MTTLDNHPLAAPVGTTPSEPGPLPLAVLLSGTFLIVLDFFIVNVALPSIQVDLHAGDTTLAWLVAGYGLTFGGLLLLVGRLGDRWGRRRMFRGGVGLFVLSSAACGLAPSAGFLLEARLVQGVAAAAVSTTVLSLIGDVYAGPRRLRALGTYSTVMGVAAASGQLVGGLLIHADLLGLGWRTIFLVNVPVGLAAYLLAPRTLPESRLPERAHVDVVEVLLSTGALVALMLPLLEGRRLGWPAWTWASLAGSALLAVLVAVRIRTLRARGRRPLVDARPLGSRPVAVGIVGQTALFLGMASYFLVLGLYLQQGRGLGPLASGLVFSILAVAYMLGTRRANALVARWGRWATVGGGVVFAAGHALQLVAVAEIGVGGSVLWLAPGLALAGAGMGIALASLVGTVMASVEPADAGSVSGTFSTLQQLGNAVGVAVIGNVYFGLAARGAAHAFEVSLACLVGVTLAVALCALGLPRAIRT